MNNHLQVPSTAPFIRCGFAAAAVVMTLCIAVLIEGLARYAPGDAHQLAQRPVAVAQR
jgi:hypothetical protein